MRKSITRFTLAATPTVVLLAIPTAALAAADKIETKCELSSKLAVPVKKFAGNILGLQSFAPVLLILALVALMFLAGFKVLRGLLAGFAIAVVALATLISIAPGILDIFIATKC